MPTLPQLIEDDIREINNALYGLLLKSEAGTGLVIDKGGFVITRVGDVDSFDLTTLAALCAASYAATESLASLVGETTFSSVYQQGDRHSLLVLNVDRFCLLALVFKASISVGAVKYFAVDAARQIARHMEAAQQRSPDQGFDLSELNLADASEVFRKRTA
ncbi:MAG TPA: roadblock/LC7 domain-containing protein [Methylomirabilota bacterium]|nr:roadblock/LC7 domain-containing protein [Methylomirabilota bacterium]